MKKGLLAVTDDLPLKKVVDLASGYEAVEKIYKGHASRTIRIPLWIGLFSRRSKSCNRCG